MAKIIPENVHILLVDDSAEIREFVIHAVLEPAGYRVSVAKDGREGLEMALSLNPDLILLDYEMPRLNGIEVLQHLRAEGRHIPVILITSYGSESVAVEVFRLGVRDYIPKPFDLEQLLEGIQRILHKVYVERERDALLVQLKQVNAQMRQRINELDTLYHVSKLVTALQHPHKLLQRIVDAALYLSGAETGMLILSHPQTGKPQRHVIRERYQLGYRDIDTDQTIHTRLKNARLTIPIQAGKRTIGTLSIGRHDTTIPLGHQQEQLLRMLADYAAIALENFRMVSELEAQRDREKRQLRNLFEHYVSPTVVERLIQNPQSVRPGGQRQMISILFADLRGFTTFTAQSTPEELMAVLNRHMAAAADVVYKADGTLDKFMGDEVMAFFNAPVPQPDHAIRAIRVAKAIIQVSQRVHQHLPPHQQLDFGVGIATGDAIVGNIGTQKLVNYTAVGQTVNKGHTLQELTPANKIWVCETTYLMARDAITARALSPIKLKGQSEPETIYEVLTVT